MGRGQDFTDFRGAMFARQTKTDGWQVLDQFGSTAAAQRVAAFRPCGLNGL